MKLTIVNNLSQKIVNSLIFKNLHSLNIVDTFV